MVSRLVSITTEAAAMVDTNNKLISAACAELKRRLMTDITPPLANGFGAAVRRLRAD
jgi:hypothetical protein